MPIFKIAGKLVFFAHVPKCGGTSVESHMVDRFGHPAFLDWKFPRERGAKTPWNRTSPQHIPVEWLERLVPRDFLDHSFAIVRHPVDRIVSVFKYQRDLEKTIAEGVAFSSWLASLPIRLARKPFYLDNHPRPMVDFVPAGATVFKLEDGMSPVLAWLDAIAGNESGKRQIPKYNSLEARLKYFNRPPSVEVQVTEQDRALIASFFAADFERFHYE